MGVNKIAMDFGNFPPKGKKEKAKKQRKRIQFLGDKYDFEKDLTLPKKGLSDTDPILKVGVVGCDCATVPSNCPGARGWCLSSFMAERRSSSTSMYGRSRRRC